jgi:integrase
MQNDSDRTLRAFFSDYFAPLFLRARSRNTRRLYLTTINNLERCLGREPMLSDLNDLAINRYLDWFRQLPRSPYSVNKERSNILAVWRFACRKRFIEVWPDIEADPQPVRIPLAWTADELCVLFSAVDELEGKICGVPARQWWKALLLTCWDSGERIGAVRAVLWENVDLEGGWVYVPAEHRKGGRRDRLYKLAPDTVHALRLIRYTETGPAFPWPYSPNYLWNLYNRILEQAGLPTDRKSKFHRIRKSVASHCEAAGANATEILGHSQRSVTRAYLDPRIVKEKQAVDVLFRPGEKPVDTA